MRRGKTIIFLLTILFAAVAVLFGRNEIGARNFPFSVIITSDSRQEELRCMKLGNEYYMFLPSYAEGEKARFCTNPIYDVFLDGQMLKQDQSCAVVPVETKLDMHFQSLGNEGDETVTFVRSENVATMYLDFPSRSMEHIHAQKGNTEPASVRLYTKDGVLDYIGSAESVQGRGNATWEAEKKSYSIRLSGEADLLEMGRAQRWVLLANAYDASHIRNKVAYDTAAAATAAFSPETAWVDLYVNGEYAGLYLLSERNEVHPERVQLPEEDSFLVSLEFPYRLQDQGYPYVKTDKGLALRIHHCSIGQQELNALWQSVENAVLAEDGIDPATGKHWEELIDLDSWAHKYLQEELFGNYDAGSISQFFYCDLSEPIPKVHAGPIWDFDNSMGRGGWASANPRSFLANRAHFFSDKDAPLFHSLYRKEAFYDRVVELFVTIYEPLVTELINGGLQEYADVVDAAGRANQLRWNTEDIQSEAKRIENFLRERLECYHDLWVNQTEYCTVEITYDHTLWGCWLVRKGDCLEQLPDGGASQWYHADTAEPFDLESPIVENVSIRPMPE